MRPRFYYNLVPCFRPRSIKRKKHEDPDAVEPVLPTKLIVTERLTRRVRRSPNPKQTLLPQTTWSAKDDLKLVLGVQQFCDLAMVHKCVKFSQKHTYQEVIIVINQSLMIN